MFRETGGIPTKQWSLPSCFVFREIIFFLEIGNPSLLSDLHKFCEVLFSLLLCGGLSPLVVTAFTVCFIIVRMFGWFIYIIFVKRFI